MQMNVGDENRMRELEEDIRRKECELHKRYSQMGKSLLEMAEGEQRTINRLVDEIIERRAELVQIKGQRECPACTAYNDADSRYCKRCGGKLPVQTIEKEME